MDIEARVLRINGLDMHIEIAGAGRPLLLLHGFPDSCLLWRAMLPGLVAAGFRVIMPDQRGFGLTTAPTRTADYTVEQIAADAIAVLDALGIGRAALMAHDWGAVIGWRLAADHPARFSRFVALSVGHPDALASAGLRQKLKSWYVLFFQWRGVAERLVRAGNFRMLRRMADDGPELARWRRDLDRPGRLTAALDWYRANFAALVKGGFPPARIPVLGIIGSEDVALTVAQMENSGRHVDATFECRVLAGAGHWLPLHDVAEIEAPVIAFLTESE